MIISRTPFRISFFGGGTDYPAWYRNHGGTVLAATIDKYCYLTCRYLPPFFEHRSRVVYSKIESCPSNDEIAHPPVPKCPLILESTAGAKSPLTATCPPAAEWGQTPHSPVGRLIPPTP